MKRETIFSGVLNFMLWMKDRPTKRSIFSTLFLPPFFLSRDIVAPCRCGLKPFYDTPVWFAER
jgi:hypothetical protein